MKTWWNKWRNRIIASSSDFLMIPAAWFMAGWLSANLPLNFYSKQFVPLLMLVQASIFFLCGLYRGMWRFASIPDLIRILQSALLGTSCILLFVKLNQLPITNTAPILYAMILILLLSGSRICFRWMRDSHHFLAKSQRVLIIGAGHAGESLLRELRIFKQYQPVGFIDDDVAKRGREIRGIRVLGSCESLAAWVKKKNIALVFIAVPSAASIDMRRIVSFCETANVPFRTLPSVKDLVAGKGGMSVLRQVLLEDLLGREEIPFEWEKILVSITAKKILVSGGGGSIGSELCRQLATQAIKQLIILDSNEYNLYAIDMELSKKFPHLTLACYLCDVTDRTAVKKIIQQHQPELIFHAAAYKHVPLLETQVRVAIQNNILGTRTLAELASQAGVKTFVLISTDKAVNPINVMGATKRAAEIICQNMNFHSATNFITVRFGNVLDSAGSVIPLFKKQLQEGGPLTVTHPEITRFFMTIPEASQLILQAAAMGSGGEVFVLDMGEPIKIRYLAEQIIKLSGKILDQDIQIQYTGLRPGEKLYEELFYENEALAVTSHIKINQAKVCKREWQSLLRLLDKIESMCRAGDESQLKDYLHQLVPEYAISKVRGMRREKRQASQFATN